MANFISNRSEPLSNAPVYTETELGYSDQAMRQIRKLSALLFLLSILAIAGVFVQRSRLASLSLQLDQLIQARRNLAGARMSEPIKQEGAGNPAAVNSGSSELLRLRNQVSQLNSQLRELGAVTVENQRLREEISKRGANSYIRRSEAQMAGYNTPADTVQTFLWSLQHHDVKTLLESFTREGSSMIDGTAGGDGRSIEHFFQQAEALVGIRLGNPEQLPDGSIRISGQVGPGLPELNLRFEKVAGQWKIAALLP